MTQVVKYPLYFGLDPNKIGWIIEIAVLLKQKFDILIAIMTQAKQNLTLEDLKPFFEGHPDGFRKVYDQYFGLLRHVLRQFQIYDSDSDELIQETFSRLFENRLKLQKQGMDGTKIKSWLVITVKNLAIDLKRAAKKVKNLDHLDNIESKQMPTQEADHHRQVVGREIEFLVLETLLSDLAKESDSQSFLAFYRDGFSVKEIAAQNQEAVSSVTSRLCRFRKKFREHYFQVLEKKFGEEK